MEQPNLKIGEKLKKIRMIQHLTLEEAAAVTGVSKPMLGQIERSQSVPTVTTLWKIATGLKVPLSSFLEESQWRPFILNWIRGAAIGQTDIPVAWRNMFLFFRESCRCFLESVRWLCGKGRQSASGRISPIHIRICLTVSAGFIIPYFIRRSHFADARRAGQSVVS